MNELSTYFGLTERKGQAVVSSKFIAENFVKEHSEVLKKIHGYDRNGQHINGLIDDFDSGVNALKYFIPNSYKDASGKLNKEYLITKDGFALLVMGFTGKKALQWKLKYINAFNQMETFIRNLLEAKADFPEFTDAIMAAHEEPKHYHFSNELDMINRIVTGMSAKQFRELNGIESGKSIRPYLTEQQILAVKSLQRIDIGLVISVPDFQQRKQILEHQFKRLAQKVLTA